MAIEYSKLPTRANSVPLERVLYVVRERIDYAEFHRFEREINEERLVEAFDANYLIQFKYSILAKGRDERSGSRFRDRAKQR